jgi:hypothetical protein
MIFLRKPFEKKIIEIYEKRKKKKKRETAANQSWPPPAGHPTFPLSPWYFKEKISKKFIEIDEKKWP